MPLNKNSEYRIRNLEKQTSSPHRGLVCLLPKFMKTSKFVVDHKIEGYLAATAWVKVSSDGFFAEATASGALPHIAFTDAVRIAGRRLRRVIALARLSKAS